MYRCVIFDLDGTLLNTLDDLANACNYALSEQGLPLHETEKFRYFVGNGIPKLIERILPEERREELYEKTHRLFCDYYDLKVFLDIDKDFQHERVMAREGEGADVFLERWIPLEEEYIKSLEVIERCDKIINAIR